MNAKEFSLSAMSAYELIHLINDNIDIQTFPIGEIGDVEDNLYWDKVRDYLTGYEFMRLLVDTPKPHSARWVQIDTDTMTINWYRSTRDIINVVGEDTLKEWYECSLD